MLKHFARLSVLFALLFFSSRRAEAQRTDVAIRQSELRGSAAPHLYAAIAELRPGWTVLNEAAAGVAPEQRALVFVNGQQVESADALRAIEPSQVVAVRLRSAEYVRRTMPRYQGERFACALFVFTRGAPVRYEGRVTLSLDVGYTVRSLPEVTRAALAERGYQEPYSNAPNGGGLQVAKGTMHPVSLGGSLHYGIRGAWGAGLTVSHTLEGEVGLQDPARSLEAVVATLTSTEAAILATWQGPAVRVGAGPAVRSVRWTWTEGYNASPARESDRSSAVGVATEMVLEIPVRTVVSPQLKVTARYYPSQSTEFSELEGPLEVGGMVVTMGLGVATRF